MSNILVVLDMIFGGEGWLSVRDSRNIKGKNGNRDFSFRVQVLQQRGWHPQTVPQKDAGCLLGCNGLCARSQEVQRLRHCLQEDGLPRFTYLMVLLSSQVQKVKQGRWFPYLAPLEHQDSQGPQDSQALKVLFES